MATHAKAAIQIKFGSEKQLTALVAALQPEVNAPVTGRSKVDLQRQNGFLVLSVDADDTVALRATLNAYLRWIASAVNVIESIGQK